MHTMQSTLLVGPADWDPAALPRDEFAGHLDAFWGACDPAIAGAIVFGSPMHHAELAYLTHFTPKLEPGIALIPRVGAPRLMVGGGANMLGAAKPLTWIENLLPLRDVGATVARWRDEMNAGALVLINGDAMPFGMRRQIEQALGAPPADATAVVASAMRRKSARELALVRAACASVDAALAAMRAAQQAGKGMTETVLAGEGAAYGRGAQDVRVLFGRDEALRPFTVRDDAAADPLKVYLAVRHDGYWAERFAVLGRSGSAGIEPAQALLREAVARMRPGTPLRDAVQVLAGGISQRCFGHRIGLALDEGGDLSVASDASFAVGEVYSVQAWSNAASRFAAVSAMVVITAEGHEVLSGGWQ